MMEVEKKLLTWLTVLSQNEEPPENIIAFNFGCFHHAKGYYTLYLMGSKNYDPDDDDWACDEDYCSKNRYLEFENIKTTEVEWQHFLLTIKGVLDRYVLTTSFQSSIFRSARAITIGFDGGDLYSVKYK